MSLLDDVSIVVTPNGYKAGELYAVIPVPTEGAEILSQPVDLVTDFTAVNGASIVDVNTFTTTGGSVEGMTKASIFTVGKRYKLIIEGTTTSSGFSFGNTTAGGNEYGTGFGTHIFTASGNDTLWIRQSTAGTTDITSFTIKEYTSADMDVTRATAATRVDENGLVNYAEIIGDEEVTNGDFATDTDWTKGTGWTISGGTANCNNTSGSTQNLQTENKILNLGGKRVQISFTVSNYSGSASMTVTLQGTGGNDFTGINANGTYTTLSLIAPTENNIDLLFKASNGWVGSIDNVSVKEVTRDNVPRIDYTGGGCPHILAEPQRTNIIEYSEDFANSYWAKTDVNIESNAAVSPDGTQNADTLNIFSGNFFYKPITSGAGTFTLSCYVKVASGTLDFKMQSFNGTDGADASSTFTANTNWQRFEFTTTVTIDSNFYPVQVSGLVGGDFLIWGAQLEEGSYATSYIPTSGSTVTRNQDIFTRDGIGSLINSTEGVLFVEMAAFSNDGTNRTIALSDGTGNNLVRLYFSNSSNRIVAQVKVGGSTQVTFDITGITVIDFNKVALKYKENDFSIWINGVERGTDTSGTTPTSMNRLALDNGSGSENLFGKVKQLQVYKTALSDTQLAALTS